MMGAIEAAASKVEAPRAAILAAAPAAMPAVLLAAFLSVIASLAWPARASTAAQAAQAAQAAPSGATAPGPAAAPSASAAGAKASLDAGRDDLQPAAPPAGLAPLFPNAPAPGTEPARNGATARSHREKVEALLREGKRLESEYPREPSSARKRKKKARRPAAKESAEATDAPRSDAMRELLIPATSATPGVVSSPATVRAELPPAPQAVSYAGLQAGLAVKSYRPSGTISLPLFTPYEMGDLGAEPMLELHLRWTPFELSAPLGPMGPLALGAFGIAGFAQNDVSIHGPTGYQVDRAKLYSLEGLAGLEADWRLARAERWGLASQLGWGSFQVVQAGSSSYSSIGASVPIVNGSLFVQNRVFERWTAFAGYQRFWPVQAEGDELRVPRENWLLGFLGSFQ